MIPLSVLVVPTIAKSIDTSLLTVAAIFTYLRRLKLAQPVSVDSMLDFAVLIGADHYLDLVEDTVIRGERSYSCEVQARLPTVGSCSYGDYIKNHRRILLTDNDTHMETKRTNEENDFHINSRKTFESYNVSEKYHEL
ncbi:hypothetical protein DPMN_051023 [Dreissena polymorpha]|uniref:Uncharacterized protein n=1 Tax=Dreissena polymorpha TaxID=45954 RepID=A0A9D4HPV2_DREPO|nr:hypothetical protein DPMN_051023 [Dreissena polymorpha]